MFRNALTGLAAAALFALLSGCTAPVGGEAPSAPDDATRAALGRPFNAINNHRVALSQREDATIEVFGRPGAVGRNYFCAAADFAERRMGASLTNYLILVGPEGPSETWPGNKSVHFLLVSRTQVGELTPNALSVSSTRIGENYTVALARRFCPSIFPRSGINIGIVL